MSDLWETFELFVPELYAVYISDGYLVHADDDMDDAIHVARNFTDDEGTREVVVIRHHLVPWEQARELLEGHRTWTFADGYSAASAATGLHDDENAEDIVFKWNMYDNEVFEDWWEEDKVYARENLLDNIDDHALHPGTTLWAPTNDEELWETADTPLEGLVLWTTLQDAKMDLDIQVSADGGPRRPRIVELSIPPTADPMVVLHIPMDTYIGPAFEEYFAIDIHDPEDVTRVLDREINALVSKNIGVDGLMITGMGTQSTRSAKIVLTENGLDQIFENDDAVSDVIDMSERYR